MIEIFYHELIAGLGQYLDNLSKVFPRYFAGTFVFLIFWIFSRIERRTTHGILKKIHDPTKKETTLLIARITRIVFVSIGLILGLGIVGVNWTALATGFGLVGFGVTFALKDYFENFLAGVIILIQKPFKTGDQIQIGEIRGFVEVIATRYTVIKSFDNRQVIVPNSDLLTKSIIRDNAYGRKRYAVKFDLDPATNLEKAISGGLGVIKKTVGVLTRPKPFAVIGEVEHGKTSISYYFWANPREEVELSLRSIVHQSLLLYFIREKILLGYETSKIIPPVKEKANSKKTLPVKPKIKEKVPEENDDSFTEMSDEF